MQVNWLGAQYWQYDGYGRYGTRMILALERQGLTVTPTFPSHLNMPSWMTDRLDIDWQRLTIACMPPFYLPTVKRPTWLITMTEGSELPEGWAQQINSSGVERVLTPCEHNADVFRRGGVHMPVSVLPGGTDPVEFPVVTHDSYRPYTFLALADRGARKGWGEVWAAFYKAFGTPVDTPDVRLIIKWRDPANELVTRISQAEYPDPRIRWWYDGDADMAEVYAAAHCFAIPSRSEGWGMPHREAAMMGVPVITQAYSGLDDGHTADWSIPIDGGHIEPIPAHFEHIAGEWLRADVTELARTMRRCYEQPEQTAAMGQRAAAWLRANQTWDHAAALLRDEIADHYAPHNGHVVEEVRLVA